jgi:hypothetical protein
VGFIFVARREGSTRFHLVSETKASALCGLVPNRGWATVESRPVDDARLENLGCEECVRVMRRTN